ncbi:MAG: polysaccharide biosynthesis protein, partial [Lachnospiraceae bacterium]|nr:polysaccharide biosynthesis protein [Lachnospiraceae bacterium]
MKKRKPFNYQLLYRRACLVVYDILSVCMASALAIALRFLDEGMGAIPDYFLNTVSRMLPVNILITLLVFYIFRLYHSLWAFAGVNELQNVVVGYFCSAMVMTIIMVIFKMPIPKSY